MSENLKEQEKAKASTEKEVNTEEKIESVQAENAEIPNIPYVISDENIKSFDKSKLVPVIGISAVAVILLCVYLYGVFYYSKHFYKDTILDGIDISKKTVSQVEDILDEMVDSYVLNIKFKDSVQVIKKGDAGLQITYSGNIKELKDKQNPFLWFVNIGKKYNYTVGTYAAYDEKVLKEFISSFPEADVSKMEKSKDAYIIFEAGEVVVVDDVLGSEIDIACLYQTIADAIDGIKTDIDVVSTCYVEAALTSDSEEIAKRTELAEKYISMNAAYIEGYNVILDKSVLSGFADFDEAGNLLIAEEKVYNYLQSVTEAFPDLEDTILSTPFTRHDGKNIMVDSKVTDWVYDIEQDAAELCELLIKGEDFKKVPAYKSKDGSTSTYIEIGDTYVEIDLSRQHVYCFKEGELVIDTDCVTGNVRAGHNTPGGVYKLTGKRRNCNLMGAGYPTFVSYWMPFNGGIGLHDATWRRKFGDEIYKTNGSHGCINLPLSIASEIYDFVYTGIPVVCYWTPEDELEEDEPTTEAPITQRPTTEAPTTQAPTTETPTTQAPTTETPTTQAPTTEAPTTQAPATEAPTTQAPTTEAPTTQAPTTEAPTTQAPTTEAPTTQAPAPEAPTDNL